MQLLALTPWLCRLGHRSSWEEVEDCLVGSFLGYARWVAMIHPPSSPIGIHHYHDVHDGVPPEDEEPHMMHLAHWTK